MSRFPSILWTVAVQLVVGFVLLEVLTRWLNPGGISYYPETARYLDTMIIEEPIGYRNQPELDGTFWDVPVRTNELGLRDRPIPATRSCDEIRVIVSGDSVPFGLGVPVEHSIPVQLEQQLNELRPGAWHYRTFNLGVPSYNSEQARIQLETLGPALDPDLVLLMYSKNDIESSKTWVFDRRASIWADGAQRSAGLSLLFVIGRTLGGGIGTSPLAQGDARYSADRPEWARVEEHLTAMHEWTEAAGIPFVLTYRLGLGSSRAVDLLEGLAARLGVPVHNVNISLDPRWSGQDPASLRNSFVDAHRNRAGSVASATLIRESLLPELAGLERMAQARCANSESE